MHRHRTVRRTIVARIAPLAVAVTLLAFDASGAAAVTKTVSIPGWTFAPKSLTVGRGTTVRWRNNDSQSHDVKSKLSGYFQSPGGTGGIDAGDQWSRTFTSAGKFDYVCRKHELWGQRASITVRLAVTMVSNPARFRIAAGTRAVTGAWRHQVQAQTPLTGWTMVATTTAAVVFLTASEQGDYAFRSRVTNVSTGQKSGWSPIVEAYYQA
jgi:plastocyanin